MPSCNFRTLIMALALTWLSSLPAMSQTIQVSITDREVQGKPVFWNDSFVALMAGDGQLVTFHADEAKKYRKVSERFQSLSQATLRGQLQREFGTAFEVSGTGQFLVVHPAGQRDRWAERFEQLYRQMVHYFRARGFKVHTPEFPLVAVVFPTQGSYLQYAGEHDIQLGPSTLGFYDPKSNRIHMYDVTASRAHESDWQTNAETIIHEAAHQTAYNIGIHPRCAYPPRWLVEGIGTMFEARGVYNSAHYTNRGDRINQGQLEIYRRAMKQVSSYDLLSSQILSDDLFQQNGSVAYAHAWALTFYLVEQDAQRYARYLQLTYARPAFAEYTREERFRDFVSVFGSDLKMLDARMQRFLGELGR